MAFPDYRTWVDTVVHPRERLATRNSPWCFEDPLWHATYRRKHDIAFAINPSSILEIGVRYGYSAHAFLSACPDAHYIGVDCDDGVLNAMGEPTLEWAAGMVKRTTGVTADELLRMNTQTAQIPGDCHSALVHVDADHSFSGCLGDLHQAWRLCSRAVLVDDYGSIATVQDAVHAFVRESGATLLQTPGFLGDALLLRSAP
jgi:cephalosporin hydroxylase